MTIPQGLKLAKRSGFDYISVCISEAGYLTLESNGNAVEFLHQAIKNMSLEAVVAEAQILKDFQPGQEWLSAAKECLRICAELECGTMIVDIPAHTSGLYVPLFIELKDYLNGTDITIALRVGECSSPTSVDSVKSIISAIDADKIGLCLDTACPMIGKTPFDCVMELAHHVKTIVARDYKQCGCGDIRLVNPMQGDMDWVSFRRALIKIGYNVAILAEAPGYPQYPELGVHHLGDQMKRIFRAPMNHNE